MLSWISAFENGGIPDYCSTLQTRIRQSLKLGCLSRHCWGFSQLFVHYDEHTRSYFLWKVLLCPAKEKRLKFHVLYLLNMQMKGRKYNIDWSLNFCTIDRFKNYLPQFCIVLYFMRNVQIKHQNEASQVCLPNLA